MKKILLLAAISTAMNVAQADGLALTFKHNSNPAISTTEETGFDGFGFTVFGEIGKRVYWRGSLHKQLETKTKPGDLQGEIELGILLFGSN